MRLTLCFLTAMAMCTIYADKSHGMEFGVMNESRY